MIKIGFSLVQTCSKCMCFYVKLESSYCRIYYAILSGSIDRNSSRTFFCRIFQLSPSPFDVQSFIFCLKYKRENPSHIFEMPQMLCMLIFYEIKRWLSSHILRVSKIQNYVKNLVIGFNYCIQSLKIHKRECLYLLEI